MDEKRKNKRTLIQKKTELEEAEEIQEIREVFTKDVWPDDKLLKEWGDLALSTKKLTSAQEKRKNELVIELATQYGLEGGMWVKNLSHGKYRKALRNMRHNIVADHSCKTAVEFMLADRIVASYWRAMQYDTVFNRLLIKEDGSFSFDQLKVNILKEINKGMELATRQLNTSIILLKDIKQPKLNVKVTTDNAYIAQNQQIINADEVNSTPEGNH